MLAALQCRLLYSSMGIAATFSRSKIAKKKMILLCNFVCFILLLGRILIFFIVTVCIINAMTFSVVLTFAWLSCWLFENHLFILSWLRDVLSGTRFCES
jgi:hypothetical protein